MRDPIRDHGGNIDWARARFGGRDWIDLSTGINRVPYPVPPLADDVWRSLPTETAVASLLAAAARAYRTDAPMLAVAGAQAAIQLIPRLLQAAAVGRVEARDPTPQAPLPTQSGPRVDAEHRSAMTGSTRPTSDELNGPRLLAPRRAKILGPTYNEHAAALRTAGWDVAEVTTLAALAGADLAVVVNPNNPDGLCHSPTDLLQLAGEVGRLVVDESFADARPDLSLAPAAGRPGLLVLRSFGKFYGLAGVRLGFVIGSNADIAALRADVGPWNVSGIAIAIGAAALADTAWADTTTARLRSDATQLDSLAQSVDWRLAGGTELFRLYWTGDAAQAQQRLARNQIWSRTFPYFAHWLRLGLPGNTREWERLAQALRD